MSRKQGENFTYADYYSWDDDNRWELIDGVPYQMSTPSLNHQKILGNLLFKMHPLLSKENKNSCKILIAPCDVRLNAEEGDNTVVQPDLFIVCDPEKLADEKAVKGAPDMVIEITSPSNEKHDRVIKHAKYIEAGVKEIWYINFETEIVDAWRLKEGVYTADTYTTEDTIPVGIFQDFEIDMKEIIQ